MAQATGPRSRLLTTLRVLKDPFHWMPKWRERYGDPMLLPTMNGNVVMTGKPELVKAIFAGKPEGYGPFATEAVEGFAGRGSMLTLSGERHTRERKLLMPPFRGSAMKALGPAMVVAARRHLDAALDQPRVGFADLAQSISLEAIIRTVFGVQEEARVLAFTEAVTHYLDVTNPLFFFVKATQTRFFPPWRRFLEAYQRLDDLLQAQIERARAGEGPETILGAMVAATYEDGVPMEDEDIKGELRTLLFAGHDTTAITLAWAVDHIHRDPELRERLRDTVDALDDTPEAYAACESLEHVWRETLRLHPVATEALRTLEAPMKLGDVDAAHEYLPFGGGHRRCLGAAFAGYQLQVVLGVLLRRYDVTLLDERAPDTVRKNVTLGPSTDVPVRISARGGL